jgi:hypothetical protein
MTSGYSEVGRITYPDAPPTALIYIKPRLTASEPADLVSYKCTHPGFPHESTADQWFDESQFDSYRELGYWIARGTGSALDGGPTPAGHGRRQHRGLTMDLRNRPRAVRCGGLNGGVHRLCSSAAPVSARRGMSHEIIELDKLHRHLCHGRAGVVCASA